MKGPIKSSCTAAGCWLRLDAGDGQVLLVKSSDESVLVPKDIAGRTAMVEGVVELEHDDAASTDDIKEGHTCAQANVRLETRGVVLL